MIDPSLVNESLLAIDIGLRGGLVMNSFGRFSFWEMPVLDEVYGPENKKRKRLDLERLWALISGSSASLIVAEDVRQFPGQNVNAGGTLMVQKGVLMGMAAASKTRIEFIEPKEWIYCFTHKRSKFFVNDQNKKDKMLWKAHLLEVARELAPELHDELKLCNADAFLMWNYQAAQMIGKPLEKRTLQITFPL